MAYGGKPVKRYGLDAVELKRSALYYALLFVGIMLSTAYPLAILPVWAKVTIAVLVYTVGFYVDYSSTKWAVLRYGVEVETNPLVAFAIRRIGLPLGVLATSAAWIGVMAAAHYLLFDRGFPDNLLATFLLLGPGHLGAGLGNWIVIRANEKDFAEDSIP